jgi:hypothetical protein
MSKPIKFQRDEYGDYVHTETGIVIRRVPTGWAILLPLLVSGYTTAEVRPTLTEAREAAEWFVWDARRDLLEAMAEADEEWYDRMRAELNADPERQRAETERYRAEKTARLRQYVKEYAELMYFDSSETEVDGSDAALKERANRALAKAAHIADLVIELQLVPAEEN